MKMFYMLQQVDVNDENEFSVYRSAFIESKSMLAYGEHRAIHRLESARHLLKEIHYYWFKDSKKPIGDMLGGFLFSEKAVNFIKSFNSDLAVCEPISIEGFPAYYIEPQEVNELKTSLDYFESTVYRSSTVVSQAFKEAWESSDLLGAKFKNLPQKT